MHHIMGCDVVGYEESARSATAAGLERDADMGLAIPAIEDSEDSEVGKGRGKGKG